MTSADKSQELQEITNEGKRLSDMAETLLQQVTLRNARLGNELKQTRIELEEKLAQKNK